METRLELRRRLLRIDADSGADVQALHHDATHHTLSAYPLRRQSLKEARKQLPQANETCTTPHDGTADTVDDDEEDDAGDDENDGDDEEEGSDDDATEAGVQGSGAANQLPRRNDKCETSPVVKLLFSRHGINRGPTVCFEYPLHLSVTREYPVYADGTTPRVVVLSAQDCPLFYKTHWERNCVKNAFAVAGLTRTKKRWSGWHVAWAKHVAKTKFKLFGDNQPHAQVFNHFPDPWVVGRKDRLLRTLTAHKRRFGASYGFFPEGFTLPDQMDAFRRAVQREDAALVARTLPETSSTRPKASNGSIWILKPPASACGRGIRVLASKDVDGVARDKRYVVQRYLASPLLLDGFKFDLRLYVVVTSVDPLRIYLFNEGIARFCTSTYSLANLKSRFSHLTNYSVNKVNDNFVENADVDGAGNAGSKWSLTGLLRHLEATGVLTDPTRLQAQIRAIVCKTIIAAEAHLTPLVHQCVRKPLRCYELFGFDVMLDSSLMPWLLEVNVSPSLMGGSPLDKRVKGLLLSDIFHLVGVPVSISSLPVGVLPDDLDPRAASAVPATNTQHQQPPPVSTPHLRRQSSAARSGLHRRSVSSSARAASNKQLHEVVLDPSVPHFENNHLELFAPSDWDMIHQLEDEMDRLGHFERIFPSPTSADDTAQYAPFFTCQRYSNALCAKWVSTQIRNRTRRQQPHAKQQRKPQASAPPKR
ncbi:hypothetical protein PybrP1_010984 [[Pythium] brassicae (nom. inval.)]|nr:hypothetical protein PybrP1_010984 [[Pythium] brassicae (nom. inval.)]